MGQTVQSEYMSTREAAERLGKTKRYIQKLCAEGVIPGVTQPCGPDTNWMIPRASFERWLIEGQPKPQAPRKVAKSRTSSRTPMPSYTPGTAAEVMRERLGLEIVQS